jgi:ABC-2 type transport system ATP-binding protein
MTTSVDTDVVLRAEGVGKRYKDKWVLTDCTFELRPGQVTALVGANGAGKTTLLTVLSGLLRPDSGAVTYHGRLAFVAHDKPLYERLTVKEMLGMARRLNLAWDEDRAQRWLRKFRVPDRQCGRLSTGQRAQVAFAVALGSVPDVLLLDEPLANLDPLVRHEVMAELLTEAADTGMSMLLSTHVVAELGGVADNLVILSRGQLLLAGEIDDLTATYWIYVGPRSKLPPMGTVVRKKHSEQQSWFLVSIVEGDEEREYEGEWTVEPATVEDIVLGHLANARDGARA